MKKIKVGEYVRIKYGIFKVVAIDGFYIYLDKLYFDKQFQIMRNVTFKDRIIKHSKNIIDLLQEGDYVNGYKVIAKSDDEYIEILTDDIEQGELLTQEDIETILTKEQYMKNCYKIPEKSSDIN